jgi:ABC-type multidrug transport system ATPase subunit
MELVIDRLGKSYGSTVALRDVSLTSGPGMLGLVGPNGAGKTTLMRIIATLIPQSNGSVTWNGLDTRSNGQQIRQVLGYLPQEFGVYGEFSARQFLRYLAAMKGLPDGLARSRVDELLDLVNLRDDADRKLRGYSGGMKQRVGIAQALLNDPELLIVDEPTAGLDPAERVRFRTLLASLTAQRLVILSTHIIGDVEAVANRLVVLNRGAVVADTSPEGLLARAAGQVWSVTVDSATALRLQRAFQVSALVQHTGGVSLRIVSPTRPAESAAPIEPTLEDAYLLAVGETPVDVRSLGKVS